MLERGRVFAGHRIEAVAGSGGMGVVYRARNLALDSVRALKILPPELSRDPAFEARFRRESRLAASIEHPNVIPVHDAGEADGLLFLAMRYVDGTDLRRLLERDGRLDPGRAVRVAEQVAAALDAAHDRGLVHRDVKPANVLLEGERAYLTDFGISKLATAETDLTATGEFVGTVDYVAPEQIEGRAVDGRADVYALACVIHEALTGAPPFRRDTQLATLFAHANAPRPRASASASALPGALDRALAKGMATDPAARYASAGELVAAVRDAVGGTATRPLRARSRRAPRLRWRPLAAAAGVLAVAAVIAIVALSGGDDQPPEAGPAPEVTATARVGPDSTHLAVGEGSVWAPSLEQGRLYEVDEMDARRAGGPIRVGAKPLSAAVGFGSVWVVGGGQAGSTWRVDPSNRSVGAEIPVGSRPSDLAVGEGGVWLTNEGDDRVQRVDPAAGSPDTEGVPVGQVPRSVAVGEGGVWVTNVDDGTVSQIDPETVKTVGTPIEAGQRPSDVAAGAGSVWAMDNFNGEVTRIDPGSARRVGDPIAVGNKPRGIAVGLGYVWVANGGDDTVVRIEPASGELVGSPIEVGDEPADIAIGDGAVWTVNFGDSTVSKIQP